jgi:hypothetical protein
LGGPIYNLSVHTEKIDIKLQVIDSTGDVLLYLGILLIVIGVGFLISIYKSVRIHPYLYFSPSLNNMDEEIPIYAVEKQDKHIVRPQKIGPTNTYIKDIVKKEYVFMQTSFEKRIDHSESNKIYMAVIGSFPYMYLMGSLLRNGHINSLIMEYNNQSSQWKLLETFGPKATHVILNSNNQIDDEINRLSQNGSQDIGIALCYTFEIFKNTIDPSLQENTLYLKNSLGFGHYLLNSNTTQDNLINELLQYIQQLSQNGKRIHLFIAAQSSFCVNLGKRYQDNATGTIVLHNYDGDEKKYTWNIEFKKGDIR